jgi:uncharacterized small protein (DUF1192 family)
LPDANANRDSLATAVTEVSERMSVLIREEIELAKAEMSEKISSLARGAVAIAIAAVFGLLAVPFALLTLAWGLNSALTSIWLGFLIVLGVLLAATAGAVVFAVRKFKGASPPTPKMAIDEAKKIRETVTVRSESST